MSSVVHENPLQERFDETLQRLAPPSPLLLAVSGGSDSTALLRLAAASPIEPRPTVVTVDHGLRPEAAGEATQVKAWSQRLGLDHHTLCIDHLSKERDIQSAARAARYEVIGEFCMTHGFRSVLTGHTLNDQAETFLMRLARGSGLDGLSAMGEITSLPNMDPRFGEIRLCRPLLAFSRAELRHELEGCGQDWIEDPSNANQSFERVRIRKVLASLGKAGLEPHKIARSAAHLNLARANLDEQSRAFTEENVEIHPAGYALVDRRALQSVPDDLALRALGKLLMLIGGRTYGPSRESLARLLDLINRQQPGAPETLMTLSECEISQSKGSDRLLISREYRRSGRPDYSGPASLSIRVGERVFWDNRFVLELSGRKSAPPQAFEITFLGDHAQVIDALCKDGQLSEDMRKMWDDLPKRVRKSLAGLFADGRLLIVPYLSPGPIPLDSSRLDKGRALAQLRLSATFKGNVNES